MKKNLLFILMIITIPVLIFPVSKDGITIKNFVMDPLPFNERRDPVKDSPYNAFDGDKKTSALYSDFTIEFNREIKIDQIKIINGDASSVENFKKINRVRDIEITLYTSELKQDKPVIKKKKSKKKPAVEEDKKIKTDKDVKKQNLTPEKKEEQKNNEEKNKKDSFESVVINHSITDIILCRSNDEENYNLSQHDEVLSEGLILTKNDNIIEIIESKKDNNNSDEKKSANEPVSNQDIKKIDSSKKSRIKKNKPAVTGKSRVIKKRPENKTKKNLKDSDKNNQKKPNTKNSSPDKKSNNEKSKKDPADNKTDRIINKTVEKQRNGITSGSDKKNTEKEKLKKDIIPEKKEELKKVPDKNNDTKNIKDNPRPDKEVEEEIISVKKMTGIVKVQEKGNGIVLVYASLKDSDAVQSIGLKASYSVKKISFRTRDDEYYHGNERDRSVISEIEFFSKNKKIAFSGINELKKSYIESYNRALHESIAGNTFVMYLNNEIELRVLFNKDGSIEYHDRFKCRKSGDIDCTVLSMPDAWRISDNRLYFRYHTIWRIWKYDLDCCTDIQSDKRGLPSRWMRLYYKSETGFQNNYLDLKMSDKNLWSE